ncbi:MAG: hypothetical protein HC836_15130 [Richelia sp. RM2_1_2]|nr:hypothetical protein [Richelia sp. SM2_1_7]NJM17860.1 hypothetical protein [Richelia sp. SM1_7_0]NJN09523.1 hypothetical protein [Richelia sp. RM1_1_1]NJO27242.1 hypothetical protein [Richelia sp. SL_2_1]NJO59579.1 hypothetical protein [Richelia sp. RM2_1_2]
MDAILTTAKELHSELLDFMLDAEDDLAVSLEAFSAEHLASFSDSQYQGAVQNEMVLNMFLTEGKVGDKQPIDLFLESHPNLSSEQRNIVDNFQRSFAGLFVVKDIFDDGFALRNWLTEKEYIVKISEQEQQQLKRAKAAEILLARIVPVNEQYWMFSSPVTVMGRLGKPKLAVAIGNFKKNYQNSLYGDAPELLEEAWLSVEKYHQGFIDFFNSDEITLPGYQLEQKLSELQEQVTQNKLAAAGIDSSKSLKEMVQEADISEQEMSEVAEGMGIEGKAISQVLDSNKSVKMVMPKVELPPHLKKAEEVTVLSFPRWGQIFLTNYTQFKNLLIGDNTDEQIDPNKLVKEYLESPDIKACVWQRLSAEYPEKLEKLLQQVLNRPEFDIKQDLVSLLSEFNKNLNPVLPEIASVPLHLHNLFQEALAEVKGKSNKKGKTKSKGGFGG